MKILSITDTWTDSESQDQTYNGYMKIKTNNPEMPVAMYPKDKFKSKAELEKEINKKIAEIEARNKKKQDKYNNLKSEITGGHL